ncbi:hypothetical protein OMW55_01620 [Sphingomonas sp. BN140010]|uniref:Uncharacterized protein n=1 Tax=Sphingomonas arvum TaxID=2992113 RepID=A0ABT3JBS4_9SPHN|nr:hypothetical protein [Sphingomonas sp. BN140010]MCW3796509.1 hypothetical protein [Sphingomonas sp. BN140010]
MIRLGLFLAAFFLCATYAYKVGGQPERAAITAQGFALIITLSTELLRGSVTFSFLVWGWLVADTLLIFMLIALALRANRIWTMVLAGLQLAAIFAHVAKALYPQLPPLAYALFLQFWGWPMLVCTMAGTLNHRSRVLRGVSQPEWKPRIIMFAGQTEAPHVPLRRS